MLFKRTTAVPGAEHQKSFSQYYSEARSSQHIG